MELVLAYGAGLMTLINPCVLPVLPIVLVSALQADRRGPLALTAGLCLSFVALGMFVFSFGFLIGVTQEVIVQISAVIMVFFGLVLLVPGASGVLERAMAGLSRSADARMHDIDGTGLSGQFLGGILLGAVWSPCIGPTLGSAIMLASTGEGLTFAALIMLSFALGVSTLLLALAYGARSGMSAMARRMRGVARVARPALGATFAVMGVLIFFGIHKQLEIAILSIMPNWLVDLSVIL